MRVENGTIDRFRFTICDTDDGEAIVSDNQIAASHKDPQLGIHWLAGGSIVIHKWRGNDRGGGPEPPAPALTSTRLTPRVTI